MPTAAKATTARRPEEAGGKAPRKRGEMSSLDYMQQAIEDVDHARGRAGAELRESLDSAVGRLREAVADLRTRAEHQAAEFERVVDEATEDARREYGRRAIMAQRSPEALKEMGAAVRKRKAELTEEAGTAPSQAAR